MHNSMVSGYMDRYMSMAMTCASCSSHCNCSEREYIKTVSINTKSQLCQDCLRCYQLSYTFSRDRVLLPHKYEDLIKVEQARITVQKLHLSSFKPIDYKCVFLHVFKMFIFWELVFLYNPKRTLKTTKNRVKEGLVSRRGEFEKFSKIKAEWV